MISLSTENVIAFFHRTIWDFEFYRAILSCYSQTQNESYYIFHSLNFIDDYSYENSFFIETVYNWFKHRICILEYEFWMIVT